MRRKYTPSSEGGKGRERRPNTMKTNLLASRRRALVLTTIVAVAAIGLAGVAGAHPDKKGKGSRIKVEMKGAFLGVTMQELTEELQKGLDSQAKDGGVLISSVVDGSAADEAGIEEGDVIVEFDGKKVDSPEALRELIAEKKPGDKVKVKVVREGKSKNVDVALGDWEDQSPLAFFGDGNRFEVAVPNREDIRGMLANLQGPRLGVSVHEMNKDLSSYFGVKEDEGLLVLDVEDETTAADAGVKSGDVILEVGKEEVKDVGDIRDALENLDEGDKVAITVMRDKKKVSLEGEFKPNENVWIQDHPMHFGHPQMEFYKQRDMRRNLQDEIDQLRKEVDELKKGLDKS